ncbi:hypothetical protein CN425_27455 [Bacillus cereus]|uniref:Uncharacterized protein n=1 Tax=Bacillus cereus TaxID=1396 RepID=A0A2A8PNL3_BACCE|nr:hypothetical protein ICU_04476 [Bacillus cereus BAG2X1-1]EJS70853.1 hypothetical protein ICY_04370 [Bacillus cereus BAG2X1-3]PEA06543.1 hypothetical protein CON38_26540 [Bacillus cereus]PEV94417.1 hypothetical protein CN425_27455 [Bacillus cereus]
MVLFLLAIAYMLVGNYFYNYALNAKREKEFWEDNPYLVETVSASGDGLATNEEKNANFVSKYKPNTVTKLRAGYDLEETSAIKQVAKSKT